MLESLATEVANHRGRLDEVARESKNMKLLEGNFLPDFSSSSELLRLVRCMVPLSSESWTMASSLVSRPVPALLCGHHVMSRCPFHTRHYCAEVVTCVEGREPSVQLPFHSVCAECIRQMLLRYWMHTHLEVFF